MRRSLLIALSLAITACAGKDGPAGLTGPAGPQGTAGPGTHLMFTAPIGASGGATVALPAAAGTLSNPPALTCYVTSPGSTALLLVASSASNTYPYCGLVQSSSGGGLVAVMSGATQGSTALFVIVY
jgi:hypothetical protein